MFDPNDPVPHWTTSTMRQVALEPTLADAALRYANLGVPVFPCVPGGKQPLTPNGFHDATSSARVVHAWWQRTPDANIGLPTGAVTGVVVVDIDVHGEASGFEAFERARSAGRAEGWGWLVRTPSGGLHAYYPATPGVEQRCWQAPSAHIDFRGDGGYVIAPPSRIDVGGRAATYDVIAVTHVRSRPLDATGLRHFLEPPRRFPPPRALTSIGCNPDALAAWVARTPEGGRNYNLFRAACLMVKTGHSFNDTAAVLAPAAQRAGLPDAEIDTTLRSAHRLASRLGAPASRPGPTQRIEAIGL
ncbi:bifunctional DNA primase/polymerase [Nocardioides cheoyonin]|jgi:hypothetical protein|uniref:bifunctional DNA primase/polymerase n=1 Tax=Nocardioides cheoyonin TaxID=3156615 RepID=UPI0032B52707